MAEKTCPQCGETVEEAKAFCPACGNAFVEEEQRTDASAYEQADHTMQMGQTMYNNMLSDMGLNIKKAEPEKRVEVLKPVAVHPAQVLQPAASAPPAAERPAQAAPQETEKRSGARIWIVTLVVAIALLLILLAAVVGVGLYLYFKAGRV